MLGEYSLEAFQAKGGARAELGRIQQLARRTFDLLQKMDLTFIVYHSVPMRVATITSLSTPDYSERNKDLIAAFIQRLAQTSEAICVAMVSESWYFKARSQADYEDMRAYQARNNGSMEGHPAVSEALFVSFECARFSNHCSAEISERTDPITGTTRRSLGPWRDQDEHFKRREGRFVGILKPVELAEN